MDDSDQDFTDLFSRLLKRVRKKGVGGGESGEEGKRGEESQPLTRTKERTKQRYPKNSVCSKKQQSSQKAIEARSSIKDSDSASQTVYKESAVTQQTRAVMATTQMNGTQSAAGEAEPLGVKEIVVRRMQRFKRTNPQRLERTGRGELRDAEPQTDTPSQPRDAEPQTYTPSQPCDAEPQTDTPSLPDAQEFPPTSAPEPTPGAPGDEALAIRLQQELDTEVKGDAVDLELGGLFFCQICQRDLSNMSAMCRAQHINRCLDQSERSASPKPAPPRVPDCPICGKGFKSGKSRGSHLKRCAADMGVGPALLMEVLQRQAAEGAANSAAGQQAQVGGSKRKGSAGDGRPAKKKPRKKPPAPDEDTLVAMALSRSMMEQEKNEMEAQLAAPTLGLQWRSDRVGKRRGKKGCPSALPPALLVQDPQAALRRLQDRAAALLLRIESPPPPTPDLPSSTLPAWTGAAPLWQRSTLRDGGPTSILDFYSPALRPPIEPWVPSAKQVSPDVVPPSQRRSVSLAEPILVARGSPCPAEKHLDPSDGPLPSPALSADPSSSLSALPVGSQTLRDVMDLAEEGMTLTQCGGTSQHAYDKGVIRDFRLSGFVPETERESESKVALIRLSTDLASMVNNPQLSDVQLQVDCGDVFFAHSFMLYARCPMLIEMVHDSGFGVREEGMPQAQRVLLGEVPAKAVLALLHYIYTGHCPLTPELLPHVQELAIRFAMTELEGLCLQNVGLADDAGSVLQEPVQNEGEEDTIHDEQNFLELLRSMWEYEENEDDSKEGGANMRGCGEYRMEGAGSPLLGAGELGEERVDEDELNEIYEFAATQKRIQSSMPAGEKSAEEDDEEAGRVKVCKEEEEDQENGENGDKVSQEESREKVEHCEKQFDVDPGLGKEMMINGQPEEIQPHKSPSAETSLDKSYNCLFSQAWGEYVEPSPGPSSCHSHSQCRGVGGAGQPGLLGGRTSSRLQHGEVSRLPCFDSQEAIIDLSVSPPPEPCSMFPVTGHSLGSVEYKEKEEPDIGGSFSTGDPRVDVIHSSKEVSCKDSVIRVANLSGTVASSGCRERCITPEVIVLSDSGDEMDLDPKYEDVKTHVVQNQQTPLVPENQLGDIDNPGVEPGELERPSQAASKTETLQAPANSSHMDSSVDSSWLVPGTPVCPMKVTRTSSTQTHNSLFRTQLFPRSLDNKSRSSSSSSSPTSDSIPVTSMTHKQNGTFCPPDRVRHCSTASLGVSSSFHSPNHGITGLNKGDSLKGGNTVAVEVSQTEDLIRPDGRSVESSHAQPGLSRRTSICTGIEWTGVPPAASSTPLALCPSALRYSVLHGDSEHSSRSIQSSVVQRTGSADGPSAETPQGDSPGSLHPSLVATSPSTQRDSDLGVNPRGSPGSRSSRESDCLRSPGNGNLSKTEENLFAEPWGGSSPGQTSCAMDEPPMPFDESWGMSAHFSLRMDSSTGTGPPEPVQGDTGTGHVSPPAPPVDRTSHRTPPELCASMLDSKIWDDWEEDEEQVDLPLSQRVCPIAPAKRVTQLKTPVSTCRKNHPPLEPITPMPGYSDMETPELKNRLNKFGVRPLPKRQMVMKLKEIHQYTHQLLSSDSEEEVLGQHQDPSAAHLKHRPEPASASASRDSKQPVGVAVKARAEVPALRQDGHEDGQLHQEPLSASQASTASSTAASEDSERSNPELCPLSEADSDSDEVTSSQAASRDVMALQAVRHLLQGDPELYTQILQYQPLVLSQLQARLKEAGIRLGATKLLDFLDSQCITFTTANPAKASLPRGRGKGRGRGRRLKGAVKTSA